MRRRAIPAVFCFSSLVILLLERSPTALTLVALSVLALGAGYFRRGSLLPYVSALLLYVPAAVLVSSVIGPVEGSLAAASALVLGAERMSFESDLAKVLEAPTGVDSETSVLAYRLSSAHLQRLGVLAGLVALVAGLSAPLAGVTFYVPVLVTCASVLLVLVYLYARVQH